MKARRLLMLLVAFAALAPSMRAQEAARSLPEITEHGPVVYPPLARQARVQGSVHLQVTTDGHTVIGVAVADGHPLLVQSAVVSAWTWRFADHVPGTFEVTFRFRLLDDVGTFLQQPGVVGIVSSPSGGVNGYTLPEMWNARLQGVHGSVETALSLWTYDSIEPELDGYAVGAQNQEREIRNTHLDGDMLGFDATLDDAYGQRLKFSLIGKRTGDRIKGVFLDYWGTSGTWTAMRVAKAGSDKIPAPSSSVPAATIVASDVAYHEPPGYPGLAIDAGIQGLVHLRATTDGHFVTKIETEDGNPFLARAAAANLRTWRFTDHVRRTFEVTFDYQLLRQIVTFQQEPGVVEVGTPPAMLIVDRSPTSSPAETWEAKFTSAYGSMQATFSLTEYDSLLEGDVISDEDKKEEIGLGHFDRDVLGFDATLEGPDGKPVKVSLLGKKTGDKISGVFLDHSGTAGTWNAVRTGKTPAE